MATGGNRKGDGGHPSRMESSGEDSEEEVDREIAEAFQQSEADSEVGERPSSTLLQSSSQRDPFPHPDREVTNEGVRELQNALTELETPDNAGAARVATRAQAGPGGAPHVHLESYTEGGKKKFRAVLVDESGSRAATPFNHNRV